MPHPSPVPERRLQVIARRRAAGSSERPPSRSVRPSLLDLHGGGDAWILDPGDGALTLCVGSAPIVLIRGSALDVPGLNQLLDRTRYRRPRRRVRLPAFARR